MASVLCVSDNPHIIRIVTRAVVPLEIMSVSRGSWECVMSGHDWTPDVCVFHMAALPPRQSGPDSSEILRLFGAMSCGGIPVIVLLPVPDVGHASAFMRAGACDCLAEPVRSDEVRTSVARALMLCNRTRVGSAVRAPGNGGEAISQIPAGDSTDESMPRVDRLIGRFAETDRAVFLSGESGVGKDVAAHTIHNRSKRGTQPFVARNCAAIPESLFESELFGSEVGAYTGATRRSGAFEQAHKGTVFLDEIADLSLCKQAALLRVLEQGTVRRIGGKADLPVDFRLITATNRRLTDEVAAGRFRSDLYYRICVLSLRIPPLRERPEDIPQLCLRLAEGDTSAGLSFSPAALAMLQAQPWPGNIRQLRNVVLRLSVLCEDGMVTTDAVRLALALDQ